MVCQVSPPCRSAPRFAYPGLQGSGCPLPGLTGPQCPGLPAPPPSALQAQSLGPTSCQRRGPLRGLPRSPQRWHPGPGAHNGPRPSIPQPLPSRTPVRPWQPNPTRTGLRGTPSVLPAVSPGGSGTPSQAGRGSAPPPPLRSSLTALLRVGLFPGKFLPAPQAGEGFPEQRLGHAGALARPSARPLPGCTAPRPPRPSPLPPRQPRATRKRIPGMLGPNFFFPFPRPERAMLGDVVAWTGRGGKGALGCLPGLQLVRWCSPRHPPFSLSLDDREFSWLYLQNSSRKYSFSSPPSTALTWFEPWHRSFR